MKNLTVLMAAVLLAGCSQQSLEQPTETLQRCQAGSEYVKVEAVTVFSRRMLPRSSRQEMMAVEHCIMEQVTRCNPRYKGALKCTESVTVIGPTETPLMYEDELK